MANIKQFEKIREQDRIWFVKYWANYMKNNTNKVWSSQQNILINSQITNSQKLNALTPEAYLKIKISSKT